MKSQPILPNGIQLNLQGTGKTSTLVEIIAQTHANKPDCKVLVATQTNIAADVIATRLIAMNSNLKSDVLRLIGNGALGRHKLPAELHKYSASIRPHMGRSDHDDNADREGIPPEVKRNYPVDYLKNFKIIVGTCVAIGILYGR